MKKIILSRNDRAISEFDKDFLDVNRYIEGLGDFILHCETPLTMALQGKWGSGKTSMIQLLTKKLNSNNVETFFFNTWQYSQIGNCDNLYIEFIACLIHRAREQYGIDVDINKFNIRKIIQQGGKFVLDGVTKELLHLNLKDSIDKFADALFERTILQVEQVEEYKESFQKLVNDIIEKNNCTRLVIFIDDLDRLQPEKALDLLEIIKVFLDVENCVFVLAVDYEVVVEGVKKKYGTDFSAQKGRDYFDKIIQVPFNLPTASYDIEDLISDSVGSDFMNNNNVKDSVIEITRICTDNNPRMIKRIANSYNLTKAIVSKIEGKEENSSYNFALYMMQCIQNTYHELYQFLLEVENIEYDHEHSNSNELYEFIENNGISTDRARSEKIKKIYGMILSFCKQELLDNEKISSALKYTGLTSNNKSNITGKVRMIKLGADDSKSIIGGTAEALRRTVEYILKNSKKNLEDIPSNNWMLDNKPQEQKMLGYFRQMLDEPIIIGDKSYWIGTSSSTKAKTTQVSELCKICSIPNNTIIWYGESKKDIIFSW